MLVHTHEGPGGSVVEGRRLAAPLLRQILGVHVLLEGPHVAPMQKHLSIKAVWGSASHVKFDVVLEYQNLLNHHQNCTYSRRLALNVVKLNLFVYYTYLEFVVQWRFWHSYSKLTSNKDLFSVLQNNSNGLNIPSIVKSKYLVQYLLTYQFMQAA